MSIATHVRALLVPGCLSLITAISTASAIAQEAQSATTEPAAESAIAPSAENSAATPAPEAVAAEPAAAETTAAPDSAAVAETTAVPANAEQVPAATTAETTATAKPVDDPLAGIEELSAQPAATDAAATDATAAAPAASGDASQTSELLPTIPVNHQEEKKVVKVEKEEAAPQNIDEIVVTAQKREERLQKVPIAVTVVNSEQMSRQNISQISNLSRAVPAVEASGEDGNPDTRISIRGISTNSFSVTAEQAVSYVADGVVLGKAPSVSLFDIAQIEVLRGPQGTLFGKNASAGVISVTTNKPDPSKFEAFGRAELGAKYDTRVVHGMVNIPITDDSAFRISVGQSYQSGLIHNAVRGNDSVLKIDGGRARFLWEPTPDLTINIIGDYEKQHVNEQLYILFNRYVKSDTGEPTAIPGCNGTIPSMSNRISCNNNPTVNDATTYGASAQIDWQIGDYTLTSITSARRYKQDGFIDVDGLPGNYYDNGNKFDNSVYTQEVRLASPVGEDLEYVVGGFWSKSHVPNFLTQVIGADALTSIIDGTIPVSLCGTLGICANGLVALNNPNQYIADLKSYAVFGQATYRVLDDLKLIAGARWTRDDVQMTSTSYLGVVTSLLPLGSPLMPLNEPLAGQSKVNNISWKLGLQYDISKSSMAYLTASHGYKGPQVVFNPPGIIPTLDGLEVKLPAPASISIVKPEYPMDYEAGIKSTFFGGIIATNINVFHTTIKDFQSSVFTAAGQTPNNISQVVTKGIELDMFGFLAKGLVVNSGILYNKVTFPAGYMTTCTQVGPECPDTDAETLQDIGGKQMTYAPRFKFLLAPEYEFGVSDRVSMFVGADVVYRTSISFVPSDDSRATTPDRAILGGRIGVRGADRNWEIAIFGRNLTNKPNSPFLFAPYLLGTLSSPGIDTSGQALSTESFRFIGMSLEARF
ncbi:TonB-dependent receptor [Stenotrophobium rhamnosiphilum]|uniref:TonB-dependent receptor n=1 Tax=Stenotrophobium rhamnosiphilum TaxID=2029166 RepID=A0A2T5MD73_9GAMM|nr:TonB-dependent receptor [Stenotrophobium rhamnosiphilum]PTU30529.1 hypothetical protein CJD38_13545 [Stenotrophobium rhamnosiphilum]